jgi:hypothetical protein
METIMSEETVTTDVSDQATPGPNEKLYSFVMIKNDVVPLLTESGYAEPMSKKFAYAVVDYLLKCVDVIEKATAEDDRANHGIALSIGDEEGNGFNWEGTILQASVLFEDHIMPMLRGIRPYAEPSTALEE